MVQTVPAEARPEKNAVCNLPAGWRWSFCGWIFLLLGFILVERALAAGMPENRGWAAALLVVAATVSTLISLSRQLPAQNVLLAATLIAVGGGVAQMIGTLVFVPPVRFQPASPGVPWFPSALPWWVPLTWIVILLNSRGTARVILRPWRENRAYGIWLLSLGTALCLAIEMELEPFAARMNGHSFWDVRQQGLNWHESPAAMLPAWTAATALVLALATPALIQKKPVELPPDYHPAALWILLNILCVTDAIARHSPCAAAFGAGAVLAVVLCMVRGARRQRLAGTLAPLSRDS